MKSKKWLVLLLVFAMILSLAACSKKAANDPAPSTDPVDNSAPVENTAAQNDADVSASTEKTEDKGTVKIGVTGPQTGDYAYQGLGYVAVAEIAAELWNAKDGKCGGYTIEVVDYDDKNSGDEIAVIAEKLAEDPDVMGVIGSYTSGTCMVAAPIFQEYGVVEIASAGHANFATTGDYIFRNNYMVQTESEGCLEAVTKTLGVSKIGILAVDTEWGHSTSEVMIDLMPDLGVELVCDVQYVLEGNDDYSSYVSTFINSGCEAVVCVAMPPTTQPFTIQMRQAAPDMGIVGFGNMYDDSTLANCGEYAEGMAIPVAYFNNEKDPDCKAFIDAFYTKTGRNPNTLDAQAYGGAMMICEPISKVGADRAAIRDYIANIEFICIDGVTTFDETGAGQKGYYQVQVQDGKFVLVG